MLRCSKIIWATLILSFHNKLHILAQAPEYNETSISDGLKRLYLEKLKPLEVAYHFDDFVSPFLVSDLAIA